MKKYFLLWGAFMFLVLSWYADADAKSYSSSSRSMWSSSRSVSSPSRTSSVRSSTTVNHYNNWGSDMWGFFGGMFLGSALSNHGGGYYGGGSPGYVGWSSSPTVIQSGATLVQASENIQSSFFGSFLSVLFSVVGFFCFFFLMLGIFASFSGTTTTSTTTTYFNDEDEDF